MTLTSEQESLQRTAREFAKNEIAPYAAQWDRDCEFPIETLNKAGALGFCGMYTPTEYNGAGLTRQDTAIIFEELGAACPSTAAYISISNIVSWVVATYGTKSTRHLASKLASGEYLGSYCMTEPGAGSDAAGIKTKAEHNNDHYVINGSKVFISGAGSSDYLIVFAATDEKEISAFVVNANAPGVSYGKNESKLGWHSQPTRQITFEDVKVPEHCLLGKKGQGLKIALEGLNGARVNISSISVGGARTALTLARDYMNERKQFGKHLSEFQALQFKLADMTTDLVAARQMVKLAASQLDTNDPNAPVTCAMTKRFATDAGFNICNEALQIHGGYGYLQDFPVERFLRDLRVHQILEGTNEIMRLIIARKMIVPGVIEQY